MGLQMALEFGPNLNQPVNNRLKLKFPDISDKDLDQINQLCYLVRDKSHHFIYSTLAKVANKKQTIPASELEMGLKQYLDSKYLWINAENLGRLYSQGCYYAWKDGLIDALGQ
jgi:hypothetical protein